MYPIKYVKYTRSIKNIYFFSFSHFLFCLPTTLSKCLSHNFKFFKFLLVSLRHFFLPSRTLHFVCEPFIYIIYKDNNYDKDIVVLLYEKVYYSY